MKRIIYSCLKSCVKWINKSEVKIDGEIAYKTLDEQRKYKENLKSKK